MIPRASHIPLSRRLSPLFKRPWLLIYSAIGLYFLATLLANLSPGEGFTSMLQVGEKFYERATPSFRETSPRIFENSSGYDAQFYAQLALDPSLQDPGFARAIDNFPYRARRILMPATAWALGLGKPNWIVNLYPLINPICWILSAILLTHWLPPKNFQNLIRWAGILLSWGWATSIQSSLTDGPAATLTLFALYLLSKKHPISASWSIAASILTKDTSLLTSAALLPTKKLSIQTLAKSGTLIALSLTPIAIWGIYMHSLDLSADSLGSRNFSLPFVALSQHAIAIYETTRAQPHWANILLALGTLATFLQIIFLLVYPQWKSQWWRCGIGFAILGSILGSAVWEGTPSAAPRVLLALHIAFNMLVPRGKAWLPLLLLANISVLDFSERLRPAHPSAHNQKLTATKDFLSVAPPLSHDSFHLVFQEGWETLELYRDLKWRWTLGEANIELHNLSSAPIVATTTLRISTHYTRTGKLLLNGVEVFEFQQSPTLEEFTSPPLTLLPGKNRLTFSGTPLGKSPSPTDKRQLGLSLFQIKLHPVDSKQNNLGDW